MQTKTITIEPSHERFRLQAHRSASSKANAIDSLSLYFDMDDHNTFMSPQMRPKVTLTFTRKETTSGAGVPPFDVTCEISYFDKLKSKPAHETLSNLNNHFMAGNERIIGTCNEQFKLVAELDDTKIGALSFRFNIIREGEQQQVTLRVTPDATDPDHPLTMFITLNDQKPFQMIKSDFPEIMETLKENGFSDALTVEFLEPIHRIFTTEDTIYSAFTDDMRPSVATLNYITGRCVDAIERNRER